MARAEKYWSIQALRFVAAALVVYGHSSDVVFALTGRHVIAGPWIGGLARCGVDIFFVISGFIIARTSGGLTAGEFVAKRARRILPLYFGVAALFTVAAGVTGSFGWREVLATWFLWPATDRIAAPLVPVAWTLQFEVLFYAAFTLVLWRKCALWPLLAVYLAALTFRSTAILQFVGNPIVLEFLAGVGLAYLPRWRPAIVALPVGALWMLVSAMEYVPVAQNQIADLRGDAAWGRVLTLGIPAILIVWGTLQCKMRKGIFTYLGDASYALYLFHPVIVFGAVAVLSRFVPPDIAAAGAFGASVIVACRVYELFEKPAMAWMGSWHFFAPKAHSANLHPEP